MHEKLRQNLIIAIVIIAVIAIFAPLLLSKYNKEKLLLQKVVIPKAPQSPLVMEKMAGIAQQEQKMEHISPIVSQQPKAKPSTETHKKSAVKEASFIKPIQHKIIKSKIKPQKSPEVFNFPENLVAQKIKESNIRAGNETSSSVQRLPMQQMQVDTAKTKQTLMKAKSYDKAWVIQLGYFLKKRNAENLVKKLNKEKFSAFMYKEQVNKKPAVLVYVGPYIQLSEAKTVRDKINEEIKIKGIIVKFDATKLK